MEQQLALSANPAAAAAAAAAGSGMPNSMAASACVNTGNKAGTTSQDGEAAAIVAEPNLKGIAAPSSPARFQLHFAASASNSSIATNTVGSESQSASVFDVGDLASQPDTSTSGRVGQRALLLEDALLAKVKEVAALEKQMRELADANASLTAAAAEAASTTASTTASIEPGVGRGDDIQRTRSRGVGDSGAQQQQQQQAPFSDLCPSGTTASSAIAEERKARGELEIMLCERAAQIEELVQHVMELRAQLEQAKTHVKVQPLSQIERELYVQARVALEATVNENMHLRADAGAAAAATQQDGQQQQQQQHVHGAPTQAEQEGLAVLRDQLAELGLHVQVPPRRDGQREQPSRRR